MLLTAVISVHSTKPSCPSPSAGSGTETLRCWHWDLGQVLEHEDGRKGRPGTWCAWPGLGLGRKQIHGVFGSLLSHMPCLQSPYNRTFVSASTSFCHTSWGTLDEPLLPHLQNAAINTPFTWWRRRINLDYLFKYLHSARHTAVSWKTIMSVWFLWGVWCWHHSPVSLVRLSSQKAPSVSHGDRALVGLGAAIPGLWVAPRDTSLYENKTFLPWWEMSLQRTSAHWISISWFSETTLWRHTSLLQVFTERIWGGIILYLEPSSFILRGYLLWFCCSYVFPQIKIIIFFLITKIVRAYNKYSFKQYRKVWEK